MSGSVVDARDNPFFVLGLATDAKNVEVERTGQKLLGLLQVGSAKASAYETPLGASTRDSSKVREAMNALRDPTRRVVDEILATAHRHPPPDQSRGAEGWAGAEVLRVLRKRSSP